MTFMVDIFGFFRKLSILKNAEKIITYNHPK